MVYFFKWFTRSQYKSTHIETDMSHIVVRFEKANKQAKPQMDSESRG